MMMMMYMPKLSFIIIYQKHVPDDPIVHIRVKLTII